MDTKKTFFVFGLQKSGTKYLKSLIELNTDLQFHKDYAWKHDMDTSVCRDDDVVKFWITKSPYNWVSSVLYRHRVDILSKYKKYKLKSKEGLVVRDLNIKSLMNVYNDYHRSWLETGIKQVKYEEILNDCFWFFKQQLRLGEYKVSIPPNKNVETSKFYIKQEVKEEYLSVPRYNDPLVIEINRHVDHEILKKLNYEVA
jgi:hypothetical protein